MLRIKVVQKCQNGAHDCYRSQFGSLVCKDEALNIIMLLLQQKGTRLHSVEFVSGLLQALCVLMVSSWLTDLQHQVATLLQTMQTSASPLCQQPLLV